MVRASLALGALLILSSIGLSPELCAQKVGSWRNFSPGSVAIVHDEQGRRLFWDANGQVVGRYSFGTGEYRPISSGERRDESEAVPEQSPEKDGSRNPHNLALIHWGRGRDSSSGGGSPRGPKIISGNYATSPIVRYTRKENPHPIVAISEWPATRSTVSLPPMGMP